MNPEKTELISERSGYWDSFYGSAVMKGLASPSQFAAFVAQEATGFSLIVEVGCGNGRDSIFFARQGFKVVGVDGSTNAVEGCRSLGATLNLDNIEFIACDVGSESFQKLLTDRMRAETGRIAVYARFFLHAITEDEQASFLDFLSRTLRPGDIVAFEYRTPRDASLEKVTGSHYRRYVTPARLHATASERGFTVTYAIEGFGFAKYKQDDAYVARCVMEKGA